MYLFSYSAKGFEHGHDEINMWEHFFFTCCTRPHMTVHKAML